MTTTKHDQTIAEATTEQTVADLKRIQSMFSGTCRRLYKHEALAPFQDDETLCTEARVIAIEAIESCYSNVVWEDDVTGIEVSMTLDLAILRLH